jgi:hypothetical protein
MATLYHATTAELTIGDKLGSTVSVLNNITNIFQREAEDFLEQRRPKGRPPRPSSWFACDKANLAAEYLDAQLTFGPDKRARNGRPHLYAVEMDSSSKQPMILANAVAVKLSAGEKDVALLLADEYWAPTQEWRFWEYISPDIVVLQRQPWPDPMALSLALDAYTKDSDTLKRFLGSLGRENL